jgi:hypothetical protein
MTVCAAGQTLCGTVCRDLQTDASNCGGCGTTCTASQVCRLGVCRAAQRFDGTTGATWEIRTSVPFGTPGFSDYSPTGSAFFFAASSSSFSRYTESTNAWTSQAALPGSFGAWPGSAWVGTDLYVFNGTSLYRYSIPSNTWTTAASGVATTNGNLTVHDQGGDVYSLANDGRLIRYTPSTNAIRYYTTGHASVSEPRVAFDPVTGLVYVVGNFCDVNDFYSVDPVTGAVTTMPPLPRSGCFNDPFCSDYSGHLYAVGPPGDALVWQFNTVTRTWSAVPNLPFGHGFNGGCTVTDTGYLYMSPGDDTSMARLRLNP